MRVLRYNGKLWRFEMVEEMNVVSLNSYYGNSDRVASLLQRLLIIANVFLKKKKRVDLILDFEYSRMAGKNN